MFVARMNLQNKELMQCNVDSMDAKTLNFLPAFGNRSNDDKKKQQPVQRCPLKKIIKKTPPETKLLTAPRRLLWDT